MGRANRFIHEVPRGYRPPARPGRRLVALVARRRDRLDAVATDIEQAGGTALAVETEQLCSRVSSGLAAGHPGQ